MSTETPTPMADAPIYSASKLGTIAKCGKLYDYKYVQKIPEPTENAAMKFGNVIHNATEAWYGPDDAPADHTAVSLVDLVEQQWPEEINDGVWEFVQELKVLDKACRDVEALILFKKPTLKAPKQTKGYLESEDVKAFAEKRAEMLAFCEGLEDMTWAKDEDAYKSYLKSLVIAKTMEDRWKPLPRPLLVEGSFNIEIGEFYVRGRIDQIRRDPTEDGEEIKSMVDIKTGRNPLAQTEAFIQSYLYWAAMQQMPEEYRTDNVAFYFARHDGWLQGKIDPERHTKLALSILRSQTAKIAGKQFAPDFQYGCKMCSFADLCESEVALWEQGSDLQVDLIP